VNEIVSLRHGEPFTDSLIIAQRTDNQPKSVSRLIHKHLRRLEKYGAVEFSDFKSPNSGRGRPIKIAYLNEVQALFLITLLDNNEIVLDFKAMLVEGFCKMRKLLAEKQTEEWKTARLQGKGVRREFTDAIKEFVALAEAQGHHGTAKFAYSNFSKLIKKPFGDREGAEAGQLAMIAATEHVLGCAIFSMVRAGGDAKDIYNNVREKAHALTGVMLPALGA
jgi:phage regulator Rha-like protein